MPELPNALELRDATNTVAIQEGLMDQMGDRVKSVLGVVAPPSAQALSSGNITPGNINLFSIDTEASAATDDLDTITGTTSVTAAGLNPGCLIVIRAENTARTVVVKHTTAAAWQIELADAADYPLDTTEKYLFLQLRETAPASAVYRWYEVGRAFGNDPAAERTFRSLLSITTRADPLTPSEDGYILTASGGVWYRKRLSP